MTKYFPLKANRLLSAIATFSIPLSIPLVPGIAQAVSFNFIPTFDTTTPAGQAAFNGFVEAGDLWSSIFNDPITINYEIGFESLSGNILAQANSQSNVFSYNQIGAALINDAKSADDISAITNLPGFDLNGTNYIAFVGTEEDGSLEVDPFTTSTLTNDNVFLDVNKANAKALGLTTDANGNSVDYSTQDATLTFNSNFTFDYDRSDGIDGNAYDFVGIAAHEIGHGLGFISGVDIVDINLNRQPENQFNLDSYAVFNTLDLFRYSDASVAVGQYLGGLVLDLAVGSSGSVTFNSTTYNRSRPYFSLDGGQTNLATFSTGALNGDGRQASHWRDNQGYGIMDPTFATGELGQITTLDIQSFDVIGYDLRSAQPVPEPLSIIGTIAAFGFGTFFKCKYDKEHERG